MNKLSLIPTKGITVKKTYVTSDGRPFKNLDEANFWQVWLNFHEYLYNNHQHLDEDEVRVMESVIRVYLGLKMESTNE